MSKQSALSQSQGNLLLFLFKNASFLKISRQTIKHIPEFLLRFTGTFSLFIYFTKKFYSHDKSDLPFGAII